ncbi:hypothetical protein ALC60_03820 [Trachymyrmex zeteki]|uniref:Uncharacterized protein n=1 Tax=Mycetomoellerius zeteki TaxID=64791 RepID=A0A151XAI9_9HYME|nr:hypothetical protein ALC60_03820 [Trachymyrmex zeteki]
MHHTAPWYLPWGLKLVPLPIPPGHPASGIPNPAGLHLLTPLPGIYAPEPRKVRHDPSRIPGSATSLFGNFIVDFLPRDDPYVLSHKKKTKTKNLILEVHNDGSRESYFDESPKIELSETREKLEIDFVPRRRDSNDVYIVLFIQAAKF